MTPTSSIRDAELGEPYIPSSICLPPEIEALSWRKRTIHVFRDPQEQLLVLAPDHIHKRYGHRVLGSGPNEAHAAASAAIGLAYHAQQPSDFCPSLRGYTFKPSASASSSLVVWNCVDPDGNVKGQADGKRGAAEDALFAFLAAQPVSELSADEFERVATPVQVQAGFGRRDKGDTRPPHQVTRICVRSLLQAEAVGTLFFFLPLREMALVAHTAC